MPDGPIWVDVIKDIPKEFLSGDFNGDGLTDVLVVEKPVDYFTYIGCSGFNQTYNSGNVYFVDLDKRLNLNYQAMRTKPKLED